MDATKKRDIGTGLKNVAKLFKRKEAPPSEQAKATIESAPPSEGVDIQEAAIAEEPVLEAPEVDQVSQEPALAAPEPAPASTAEPSKEQIHEKTILGAPAPSIRAKEDMITPFMASTSKPLAQQDATVPRKSDVPPVSPAKSKIKADRKDQDSVPRRKESKEERKKIAAQDQKIAEKPAKQPLDPARIAETKGKMRKMLAVSTRVRIDMLKEYLELENSQFLQFLVDEASEFKYKIDGDYIVLDTAVITKFTLE